MIQGQASIKYNKRVLSFIHCMVSNRIAEYVSQAGNFLTVHPPSYQTRYLHQPALVRRLCPSATSDMLAITTPELLCKMEKGIVM